MTDKFKNWAKISPQQLAQAAPKPEPELRPEAVQQVGASLQQEVGERMASVLQPMIDRSTTPQEQMFIVGGIVAFAVGVGLQAGMSETDLHTAISTIVSQLPK